MSRRCLSLFAIVAIIAGCVPVTEPLSDVSTAEPDKRLVGEWYQEVVRQEGKVTVVEQKEKVTFDVPKVKGNPKGLMRANSTELKVVWFYTTMIGKETFANICISLLGGADYKIANFAKEGDFQEWLKGKDKSFFIFKLSLKGDKLIVDLGNGSAVAEIMQKEKIGLMEGPRAFYGTPAEWLAKFLDKNKPEVIYDGLNFREFKRVIKPGEVQTKPQEKLSQGVPTAIPEGKTVDASPVTLPPLSAPSTPLEEPTVAAPAVEQGSELPRWVLPAMIGGLLLILLVLMRASGILKVKMKELK
jgi:hypothetical protein